MTTVGIVRLGNFLSVVRAFERLGRKTLVIDPKDDYRGPLVLPGQGNWNHVLETIGEKLVETNIRGHQYPYLGICMGLEVLFEASEEGSSPGVSALKGVVKKIPGNRRLPHMGWNLVGESEYYYFCHSYYCEPREPLWAKTTTYEGFEFPVLIEKGALWATQFHPEKSQKSGERFLESWIKQAK